jgi:hypothetical protein
MPEAVTILETRIFEPDEILRIFEVPMSDVGPLEASSFYEPPIAPI